MPDSKQQFVSLRVHPETKTLVEDEIDTVRRTRGTPPTQDEIVGLAMEALIQSRYTTAHAYAYAPDNRALHDKLERILNSGDEMTIAAVVPNIEIFYARLKPVAARRKSGS